MSVISRDPEIMGGTPVFRGTRVPVQTLLDYLEGGETTDDFLAGFPTVLREQVIRFLEEAKDRLIAAAQWKVFLDECIDWRLGRHLAGHEIATARSTGWHGLKNGELLARVAQQFDVFITVDRNLSFQQNLGDLPLTVIVLHARTNRLAELRMLVPSLLELLNSEPEKRLFSISQTKV